MKDTEDATDAKHTTGAKITTHAKDHTKGHAACSEVREEEKGTSIRKIAAPQALRTTAVAKSSDLVVQTLTERAAKDAELKALILLVATGEPTSEELQKFLKHIAVLKSSLNTEGLSTESTQGLTTTYLEPPNGTTNRNMDLHWGLIFSRDLPATRAMLESPLEPYENYEARRYATATVERIADNAISELPHVAPSPCDTWDTDQSLGSDGYSPGQDSRLGQNSHPEQGPRPKLEDIPKTIHVLGSHTKAQFFAFYLAQQLPGEVILLLHRHLMMQTWHDEGATIRIIRSGEMYEQSGVRIESSQELLPEHRIHAFGPDLQDSAEPPDTVISNLIVGTDNHTTATALRAIRHRLRPWSTVCIVHNGLGVIEQLNREVFSGEWIGNRPQYMLASISHRFHSTVGKEFTLNHIDVGAVSLYMPLPSDGSQRNLHLLRTLCGSAINAKGAHARDFWRDQLKFLAVNSVIGPLTVLFDCYNASLLHNHHVDSTMEMLLEETSQIILALPELSNLRHTQRLSPANIKARIVSTLETTGPNYRSAMSMAVRNGRKTDIDYYNGYLVMRAKQLGIPCTVNMMMIAMVKAKQQMKSREKNGHIPFKISFR